MKLTKEIAAALAQKGVEAISDYFAEVTNDMRLDVTQQIEDLRERIRRVEALVLSQATTIIEGEVAWEDEVTNDGG